MPPSPTSQPSPLGSSLSECSPRSPNPPSFDLRSLPDPNRARWPRRPATAPFSGLTKSAARQLPETSPGAGSHVLPPSFVTTIPEGQRPLGSPAAIPSVREKNLTRCNSGSSCSGFAPFGPFATTSHFTPPSVV